MKRIRINNKWKFAKADKDWNQKESWKPVNLPHTWYTDEDPYSGPVLYTKRLELDPAWPAAFLEFDGADQCAEVYLGGKRIGSHKGAYSRFRIEIPEEVLRAGAAILTVRLTNEKSDTVSPNFGDFTVFGGLYRDVSLLVTEKNHFDYQYWGTDGLIVRPRLDQNGDGILSFEPHTVISPCEKEAQIHYQVLYEGKNVADMTAPATQSVSIRIQDPHLWNGKDAAALYTVTASLICSEKTDDTTSITTGFRDIRITPDQGLFLNARHLRLNGVSMHQDFAGCCSAISSKELDCNFQIIDEIGANALRLSHYQHSEETYSHCDRAGLLVWAEIPMLKMTDNPELMNNAKQQLTELILQNIHHPSIFCWGIQNEIGMFGEKDFMLEGCCQLSSLAHSLDASRPVTGANLYTVKAESGLNRVTDMVGYNLYFGWYYGKTSDYGPFLDHFHRVNPALPVGISEYGVDANPALHSSDPKVKDYSEEYQAKFHEEVYPQLTARPWLWGSFVWSLFDFSSARRKEGGVSFINQKGLVTRDRKIKKDAFYYYKAQWSQKPFVHICGRRFVKRMEDVIDIKVYTNEPEVRLTGTSSPRTMTNDGSNILCFHSVPLPDGANTFTVTGSSGQADTVTFEKTEKQEVSYSLPETEAGSPVRNWFLAGDSFTKEGYFSVMDSLSDVLEDAGASAALDNTIPKIAKELKSDPAVPAGFTLLKILSYAKVSKDNIQKANDALNTVKKSFL